MYRLLVAKMSEHLVIREELLTEATKIMDEFNMHPLLRDLKIFSLVQSFCMQALHSLDIVQSQMKETMDTLVRFHGKTHQVFKEKYQQQGEDLVRANQATETVIRSWEQADPNKRSTIDKFMTTQAEEPISFYTRKLHQEQHLLAEVKKPRVAIVYKYASAKAVYYEEDEGEEGVEKTTPSTPADIFNDLEKALYHNRNADAILPSLPTSHLISSTKETPSTPSFGPRRVTIHHTPEHCPDEISREHLKQEVNGRIKKSLKVHGFESLQYKLNWRCGETKLGNPYHYLIATANDDATAAAAFQIVASELTKEAKIPFNFFTHDAKKAYQKASSKKRARDASSMIASSSRPTTTPTDPPTSPVDVRRPLFGEAFETP